MRIMLLVSDDSLLLNEVLPLAVRNPTLRKIVRRQLYGNAVAGHNSDKMLPHFAGDVSYNLMAVLEFYPELRTRQGLNNCSGELDYFLIGCHTYNLGGIIAALTTVCKVFYRSYYFFDLPRRSKRRAKCNRPVSTSDPNRVSSVS